MPVAAWRSWLLLDRLQGPAPRWAVGVVILCAIQLELGAVIGRSRLQGRAGDHDPIPISLLQAIRQLPADAKLAYACQALRGGLLRELEGS